MQSKHINVYMLDRLAHTLILLEILYCCTIGFFVNNLNFPNILKYLTDIINVFLFICVLLKVCFDRKNLKYRLIRIKEEKKLYFLPLIIIILFMIECVISSILSSTSLLLFLWGFRNTFRFFIFFISCIIFEANIIYHKLKNYLFILFGINTIIMLYQYFFTNDYVDQINGIFGRGIGNNNALNSFFCIIAIFLLSEILKENKIDKKSIIVFLTLLFLSAISELKIFFIEFFVLIVIFFIYSFDKSKWKRYIKPFIAFFASIIIATELLYIFNPDFSGIFHNPQKLIEYVYSKPYWSSTAKEVLVTETNEIAQPINRFSFFEIIDNSFFDSPQKKVFGLGFGNCDYSSYDFLTSHNYQKYNSINYTWFSSSFLFIETGWLGLTLYTSFFFSVFIIPIYYYFKNKFYFLSSIISSFTALNCFILLFYGLSLRSELSAYLIFYMLSLYFYDFSNSSPVSTVKIKDTLEKISIIIPVYNVENYIEYCLKSVINQTYKKLEIIIINDGSTDNSLEICKKIQAKDSRIKLISQSNAGLSAARNTGIKNATGEYVFFLDSDDSLELEAIEHLYELALMFNSEIVGCDMIDIYDITLSRQIYEQPKITNYVGLEIMKVFLDYTTFNIMACGKLFKKELFNNVSFPEGLLHEDEYTTPYLFELCSSVTHTTEQLYKYTQRKGSIMKSTYSRSKLVILNAHQQRLDHFSVYKNSYIDAIIKYHYFCCLCNQLLLMKKSHFNIEKEHLNCILKKKKNLNIELLNSSDINIKRKIKVIVYNHFYLLKYLFD